MRPRPRSDDADRLMVAVDALIDAVASRVLRELGHVRPEVFRATGPLPPGTTKRTFIGECRSGRVRDAVKVGRNWECAADAWHKARSKKAPVPRDVRPANDDVEAEADAYIEAAGLRATRKAS